MTAPTPAEYLDNDLSILSDHWCDGTLRTGGVTYLTIVDDAGLDRLIDCIGDIQIEALSERTRRALQPTVTQEYSSEST